MGSRGRFRPVFFFFIPCIIPSLYSDLFDPQLFMLIFGHRRRLTVPLLPSADLLGAVEASSGMKLKDR